MSEIMIRRAVPYGECVASEAGISFSPENWCRTCGPQRWDLTLDLAGLPNYRRTIEPNDRGYYEAVMHAPTCPELVGDVQRVERDRPVVLADVKPDDPGPARFADVFERAGVDVERATGALG